jgi:hypothetical protein
MDKPHHSTISSWIIGALQYPLHNKLIFVALNGH